MIGSIPTGGFTPPAYGNRAAADSRAERETETGTGRVDRTRQARSAGQLSDEELAQVRSLQQRDREVRAHEMAHVAVGGELILRGASYDYETGPDGIRYAVGGDVVIDTSPGSTPEETLEKAQRIRATALAPADPSPQDRQVAAMATQMALQAQVEIASQAREAGRETDTGQVPGGNIDQESFAASRMRDAYGLVGAMNTARPGGMVNAFA